MGLEKSDVQGLSPDVEEIVDPEEKDELNSDDVEDDLDVEDDDIDLVDVDDE